MVRSIGPVEWGVFAEWYGVETLVFQGDLFACLRFAARETA